MRPARLIRPALVAVFLMPVPLGLSLAQNQSVVPAEEESATFLERQIQKLLGGEGRDVRVSGLDGLLSSEARIALIEIADDDGVWLTVRDVALDWSRLALVRGRLQVNALTVGTVNLVRPPLPSPAPPPDLAADPDATPQPFALPELPVAVDVREFSVGGLRLGEAILGQQADFSINGNARLEGGEGAVDLAMVRIDGQEASFGLAAGYENETRRLYVDLAAREADDGLISTLAGIPGTPPLELTLQGDAPISDFEAALALRTDGVDRLAGTIGLAEVATDADAGAGPNRRIRADIGGDVAILFLPEYRAFFGSSVSLSFSALQGSEIGFDIDRLELNTQGMRLSGQMDLTADYLPSTIDLTADIGTELGLPVVLPLPGPPMLLHRGDLAVTYDEAQGDVFALSLTGEGFMRTDGLLMDQIALEAQGQLTKPDPATIAGMTARVTGGMTGFASTDEALWDAVGDEVTLDGDIAWQRGGALDLSDFRVIAGDVEAYGTAQLTGLEENATQVTASLQAGVGDLDRFSLISGQSLGGSITADLAAQFDTVTGAGSVDLTGQTRDLSLGTPDADDLLAGPVDLTVKAARQADGIEVETLMLDGEHIALDGVASIAPDFWPRKVEVTGRIGNTDGGSVSLPVPGAPTSLRSADLALNYDAATGDAFALDLQARDFVQEGQASVARLIIGAEGTLDRREGGAVEAADLRLSGDLGGIEAPNPDLAEILADGARLSGSLSWQADGGLLEVPGFHVESGDLHADVTASVTDLGADDMAASGALELTTGSLARFASLAGLDLAGSVEAQGSGNFALETGFFDIDATANGRDLATGIADLDKLLAGAPRLIAKAARDAEGLRIDQVLVETDELNLTADGHMVDEVMTLSLDGGLRDLGVFVDGFSGPLTVNTDAVKEKDVWSVDGVLTGPGGARAEVKGDAMRPDGTVGLTAQGTLPLGLANEFILPRSIAGDLGFDLQIEGRPGLEAVSGSLQVAGARLSDPATRLALEDLGLNVQIANSRADLDLGGNLSTGGRIQVAGPVTLTGNIPADITATLSDIHLVDPTLYDIRLDGDIGVNGPLTGGAAISGRVDIGRSELKIPAGLSGAGSVPDVIHVGETGQSLLARRRAGLVRAETADSGSGGGPAFPLDIIISAPQEIFVRGRGLDVELGGEISIGGTTAAPIPTGSLQLIRGRLALLARRLDFETAEISLQGDLEPDILMVASSDSGEIVAKIVIEGPASDPELRFTSDPELPEDEVLAQLFFGKPLQDLTPLEVAQLASAINTLTGGGGGLFGRLREGLGVDDLSVATDREGTTSVSAGKYITERVYTDVTFGSDGTSEVQLNYEILKDFTARGSFDNQGDTGIGFHFERDY